MMTCSNFDKSYWAHYISLEKEFALTCLYVTIDENNYETFSTKYLKLLLQIGSEVDISMKLYCKLLDSSFTGNNMSQYRGIIFQHNKCFYEQEVLVNNTNITLTPWTHTNINKEHQSPKWWKIYNKCKHDRTATGTIDSETKEYLKFANLNYTINSLAGLYQTLIFSYKILADKEDKKIKTPLPGSRFFQLNGGLWEGIQFYYDTACYINDEGHLIQEIGTFLY